MPEHEIRLRAAWELSVSGPTGDSVRRVDLPVSWPPGPDRRFSLRRTFRPPRLDVAEETLSVRLRNVPGLIGARLCGDLLLRPERPETARTIDIALPETLPGRCVLELEVDPSDWRSIEPANAPSWGHVSLVVRRIIGQKSERL